MYIIRLDPAIYVDYCADFVLMDQCRSATARIRHRNRNIPVQGVIVEARFELSRIKYPLARFLWGNFSGVFRSREKICI